MRTEFDGAAFDRYLLREADRYWGGEDEEPDDSCSTCDGSGWLGKEHCPDCGDVWGYGVEEETIEQARARMKADEAAADAAWEKGR